MAFRVNVLLDSISPENQRLATIRCEFPREILAEVNTHTIISKNTSSSRAIPFPRLKAKIQSDLYVPPVLGINQPGMQPGEELSGIEREEVTRYWVEAAKWNLAQAQKVHDAKAHKQIVNRMVENYGWTRQVLTATQWANFLALRTHPAAHGSFQILAKAIAVALHRSQPQRLDYDQWHLPFIREDDLAKARTVDLPSGQRDYLYEIARPFFTLFGKSCHTIRQFILCCWSAARCARVSYETYDSKVPEPKDDWKTWFTLVGNGPDDPRHASPMLHQATPLHPAWSGTRPHLASNLAGWIQFRKLIPNECIHDFRLTDDQARRWEEELPAGIFDPM